MRVANKHRSRNRRIWHDRETMLVNDSRSDNPYFCRRNIMLLPREELQREVRPVADSLALRAIARLVGRDACPAVAFGEGRVPNAPQLRAGRRAQFQRGRVPLDRKDAARKKFAACNRKREFKFFARVNRRVAERKRDERRLERIRVGDLDFSGLRQVKRDALPSLALHRRGRKRNSRLRHVMDWLHMEYELQKASRANRNLPARCRQSPCSVRDNSRRKRHPLR